MHRQGEQCAVGTLATRRSREVPIMSRTRDGPWASHTWTFGGWVCDWATSDYIS